MNIYTLYAIMICTETIYKNCLVGQGDHIAKMHKNDQREHLDLVF